MTVIYIFYNTNKQMYLIIYTTTHATNPNLNFNTNILKKDTSNNHNFFSKFEQTNLNSEVNFTTNRQY